MDVRYQVFVSSTYEDLKEERQKVIQALLSLGCLPASMELFPAASEDAWRYVQQVIDDCDYYVVIVAGRYGSIDEQGMSFTEREYEYASSTGKDVLCFIHEDPAAIPAGKVDLSEPSRVRLEAFKAKARNTLLCKTWSSPDDLALKVVTGIATLIRERPARGWVRGDRAITPEQLAEYAAMRTRVAELEAALVDARGSAPEGTASLAQGADAVTLRYDLVYVPEGEAVRSRRRGTIETTWDAIFGALGPLMIAEAPESKLVARLAQLVQRRLDGEGALPKGRALTVSAESDDFDTIKLQLRALGLTDRSPRKRGVSDRETYWSLTPYGDAHLMRLRALPRPKGPTEASVSGGTARAGQRQET